jgi:hypothetical protein
MGAWYGQVVDVCFAVFVEFVYRKDRVPEDRLGEEPSDGFSE